MTVGLSTLWRRIARQVREGERMVSRDGSG